MSKYEREAGEKHKHDGSYEGNRRDWELENKDQGATLERET